MKKHLFYYAFVVLSFIACYEGDFGPRETYLVSGVVYYPDSVTPLSHAAVNARDIQYYSHQLSGVQEVECEYGCFADENGYFEIIIPDGGKTRVTIGVYYRPQCDTAEVLYHYTGGAQREYSDKHGFENFTIYSQLKEDPQRFPYCEPSYPFVGDSVRIVAHKPIETISLLEDNSRICTQEYNSRDTTVLFFIPETVILEKYHGLDIRYSENSGAIITIHLRERTNQ